MKVLPLYVLQTAAGSSCGWNDHKKGVKWYTFALNALGLKYKTEGFLAPGEVFVFMGAYGKSALRTASDSYSKNFNMNLLD